MSDAETERAKKPLVESLEKSRVTNNYWLEQLAGSQADPRRLDALRTVLPNLQKVNAADLQQAARQYLRDDTIWKLQIMPRAPTTAAAGSVNDAAHAAIDRHVESGG